ncbi:piggyBac transposable element-derived protein 4-like [Polistes fuscatus]|uniref:piggyBac transposable element-derived protein 4-like n=1 Tax=Polistes fuscatus TaxID=30207 RepID=UPI001CA832A6|nr:piggyBac transposable element-derived protein 4-like [Polistes fuscatus]
MMFIIVNGIFKWDACIDSASLKSFSVFLDPSNVQSVFKTIKVFIETQLAVVNFVSFVDTFLKKLYPVTNMDDAELVRIIDELDITEEHGDSDEDEQLFAPSRRCHRRIYSNSESGEEESQDEDNESDSDESLMNFREVNVENDIQYNPRPQFLEMTGPKHMPSNISKPIEYFNLFFTLQFMDILGIETNRYAQQFFENAGAANTSTTLTWKKTTIKELRAFIAVLLEMGITRRPTIFSYWSQNHRHIPWFGQMFSRNRFQLLLKFFHTVDNSKLPARDYSEYDPTAKFEPVVAHANKIFKFHYSPHQHLSVDE